LWRLAALLGLLVAQQVSEFIRRLVEIGLKARK
jgi:hypothetical protein